jgi:hypothetical protein
VVDEAVKRIVAPALVDAAAVQVFPGLLARGPAIAAATRSHRHRIAPQQGQKPCRGEHVGWHQDRVQQDQRPE